MRLLIISNFFPPARPGGYTQWCQEVTDALRLRGHTIRVLTSNYGSEIGSKRDSYVYRLLHLEGDLYYYNPAKFFTARSKNRSANSRHVHEAINEFDPDLIFVWGMWALSRDVPRIAEAMNPSRVVYYLSDYWPAEQDWHLAYWNRPAKRNAMKIPKRFMALLARAIIDSEKTLQLQFENVICVSQAVRRILCQDGVPVESAKIVYGGTDIDRFNIGRFIEDPSAPLRLLYAGQLVAHKGVHTAIEAMDSIVGGNGTDDRIALSIVGEGPPEYSNQLREMVRKKNLQNHVTFLGPALKDDMPAVLGRHHVLVFPSTYEEPLARMTQEAMASGLVVIGTTTGGSREILKDGYNALTFEPDDAEGLARQIERLSMDPDLRRRLAQAGRSTVHGQFTLDRMVDEVEEYLLEVLTSNQPAVAAI